MEEIKNNEENIGLKLEEKNSDVNNVNETVENVTTAEKVEPVEKAETENAKTEIQNSEKNNSVLEADSKIEKPDFGETRVFKVIRDRDLDMQSTRRMVIDKELLKEKTENENVVSRKKEPRNVETVNGEFTEEELEYQKVIQNNLPACKGEAKVKVKEPKVKKEKVKKVKEPKVKKEKPEKNKEKSGKGSQVKIVIISVIVTVLVIGLLVVSTIFAILTRNSDKIISGMYINSVNVSGLTKEEALVKLESQLNNNETNIIKVSRNEYVKELKLSDLEAKFALEDAVEYAYNYGRDNNFLFNNYKVLDALLFTHKEQAGYECNEELFNNLVNEISLAMPDLALDSSYTIKDNVLLIKNSTSGIRIKKDEFFDKIKIAFGSDNKSIQIPAQECEQTKIDIDKIYDEIYKAPVDAKFTIDPYEIFKEEDGLDFAITLEEAKEMLKENKEEYEIPLVVVKPTVVLETLEDEAFPDKLAFFATTYSTADTNRNTNIALAAKSINNVVLLPGEEFSYNELIGECSAKQGYKPATTYLNGKLSTGIGGGICQVSTTLYNAVLRANLEVTQRKNHSMGVTYVPAGQDAMVSIGTSDFKFKNNRSYPIRIVAYTGVGNVTCEIYGLKQNPEYDVELFSQRVSENETGYKVETYKILKIKGKEESRTLISTDTYKNH